MNQAGVNKAQDRLNRARLAFERIEGAEDYSAFTHAWSDLLAALNNVHSSLEQAAKGNNPAMAWMGRCIAERRTDPLLRYIHHARDADEHGLASVSELRLGGMKIGATGGGIHLRSLKIGPEGVNIDYSSVGGGQPKLEITPSSARLVAVTNRGTSVDPPTVHRELPIEGVMPIEVGAAALRYYEEMVQVAVTFA